MKSKRNMLILLALILVTSLVIVACDTNDDNQTDVDDNGPGVEDNEDIEDNDGIEDNDDIEDNDKDMDHSESGEVPDNLEEAENPTYKIGDTATITTDHMEGMEGAEATVVGAYDTTAYMVSYDPTDGGERVEDHKWVVHEEIEDANDE